MKLQPLMISKKLAPTGYLHRVMVVAGAPAEKDTSHQ